MIIDSYQCIQMEQTNWPGNIGDSAAETGRYAHLRMLLGEYQLDVNLNAFTTILGYVRHPTSPWREEDFSSDQATPLYLALQKYGNPEHDRMKRLVKNAGWKTGNKTLITPGFWAILNDQTWLLDLTIVAQELIFALPYRWSDSKKWFERTTDNSGDYMNFIHMSVHAHKWVRWLVSKEVLKQKVREYYKPEVNNQWIVDLYDQVIEKYWSR